MFYILSVQHMIIYSTMREQLCFLKNVFLDLNFIFWTYIFLDINFIINNSYRILLCQWLTASAKTWHKKSGVFPLLQYIIFKLDIQWIYLFISALDTFPLQITKEAVSPVCQPLIQCFNNFTFRNKNYWMTLCWHSQ